LLEYTIAQTISTSKEESTFITKSIKDEKRKTREKSKIEKQNEIKKR